MNNHTRTVLNGTYDCESPLNKLQGQRDVLEMIAVETDLLHDKHIQVTDKAL